MILPTLRYKSTLPACLPATTKCQILQIHHNKIVQFLNPQPSYQNQTGLTDKPNKLNLNYLIIIIRGEPSTTRNHRG